MMAHQGERSAKVGMVLITGSCIINLIGILLHLRFSKGVYVIVGGLGTVGLVMIYSAFTKYKFREQWAFWFMLVYSFILILNPPVGTVLSIFTIGYLLKERARFFTRSE